MNANAIEILRDCANRLKAEGDHLSWHGKEFNHAVRELEEIRQHLIGIANDADNTGGQ